MNEYDLIVGLHGIIAALENPRREIQQITTTEESWAEVLKQLKPQTRNKKFPLEFLNSHDVQEVAKFHYQKLDFIYNRVPGNIFLLASPLEVMNVEWLYEKVQTEESFKILCLDQVSDVTNGASIIRTASFYGVDAIVLAQKNSFGLSPSFYRYASGAAEYIPLIRATNLSKLLQNLSKWDVDIYGLTEHAENSLSPNSVGQKVCLVAGTEETGISNAVLRQIEKKVALTSQGEIKSLNVSVAIAITLEKLFGKN